MKDNRTKRRLAIGSALILLCFAPLTAQACKFLAQPPDAQLARASAVFIGQVMRSGSPQGAPMEAPVPATFRVLKTIKGTPKAGEAFAIVSSSSSCGLRFTAGETWLILAEGLPLSANAPSGSLLLADPDGIAVPVNVEFAEKTFGHWPRP